MSDFVNIKIDGQRNRAKKGETILRIAGENNIYIPILCYAPIFPAQANCRLCLVEIKNQRGLKTACSTKVEEGMEILTETDNIKKTRNTNLKLLFVNHIGKCPTCIRKDRCELKNLTIKYKVYISDFKGKQLDIPVDDSGVVVFDLNKCIKCRRCIFACKTYGSDVLTLKNKGFNTVIATKNGKKLKDSGCIGCKQCAEVCPVGAIYINR